jgi:hypothetical protein
MHAFLTDMSIDTAWISIMVSEFLQQSLCAFLWLFGMGGFGLLLLRFLGYRHENTALTLGLGYFVSVCAYTFLAALLLFTVDRDKIVWLESFSVVYLLLSLLSIAFFAGKKDGRGIIVAGARKAYGLARRNRWTSLGVLVVALAAYFSFFLQVYRTSILDEWLHRPIVKSFLQNGAFPLVNPHDPGASFVWTYHYGPQIDVASWSLLTGLGTSESLDLFKLVTFLASSLLFYGLVFRWTGRRILSFAGSLAVLFCGSSFFLLDSFTLSHIEKVDWIGRSWGVNAPLSYGLTGINGVHIPIAVTFLYLIETVFRRSGYFSAIPMFLMGLLLAGFFLIGELFAVIILGFFGLNVLFSLAMEDRSFFQLLKACCFFVATLFLIAWGIYRTGGVVGGILSQNQQLFWGVNLIGLCAVLVAVFLLVSVAIRFLTGRVGPQRAVLLLCAVVFVSCGVFFLSIREGSMLSGLLFLRSPDEWGFPSEKRLIVWSEHPFFYLRTLMLEAAIVGLLAYALVNGKVRWRDRLVWLLAAATGMIAPFVFSSPLGDANLAKTIGLAAVLVHLSFFFILGSVRLDRAIFAIFMALFVFGMIPGLLMGPNIQWRWLSSQGGSIYCSQNPDCYKGEKAALLRRFEADYPGLKIVLAKGDDIRKVVDLTNAYVYSSPSSLDKKTLEDFGIGYVFLSPELSEGISEENRLHLEAYPVIMRGGDASILKVR